MSRSLSVALLTLISACALGGNSGKATNGADVARPSLGATGLHAVLSPDGVTFASSVEILLVATIQNSTGVSQELSRWALEDPILALEVFDARGQRMRTIPPSVPPGPDELAQDKKTLAPEESWRIEYSLNVFSPPLPGGIYKARMRSLTSNPVAFTVEGAAEASPWVPVASYASADKATGARFHKVLADEGIESVSVGSVGTTVSVRTAQAARAREILHATIQREGLRATIVQ